MKPIRFISALSFLLTSQLAGAISTGQSKNSCFDLKDGGRIEMGDVISFQAGEFTGTDRKFEISAADKDVVIKPVANVNDFAAFGVPLQEVSFNGRAAEMLFQSLANHYKLKDSTSCNVCLGEQCLVWYVLGRGVNCTQNWRGPTSCVLVVMKDNSTVSQFLAMPRPRMGGGN